VDNHHGGRLAAEHLVQLGHQRIAYVAGPANHSSDLARLAGYRQALVEGGIEPDPALVIPGNGRPEGGEAALQAILELNPRPTAVFCYNDMTAIGLIHAARQAGLAIPQDIAVVGFDDILFAAYLYPPLTTIAQPKVEMGQQAMDMVLSLITAREESEEDLADVVVQGKLIVRASSGADRRNR
jgi:DNA-binding LacI/PurR family transcriptional regulator